jgi:hypothetical protein
MCTSNINLKKFLKLFLEVEFYKIVIYFIFLFTGYANFSLKELIKAILPIYGIGTGFIGSYLVFYMFIPYLNLLIKAMDERMHKILIIICFVVNTVLQTFFMAPQAFTYVGLFMELYFIGAYIRIYSNDILNNIKYSLIAMIAMLVLSWVSIMFGAVVYYKTGTNYTYYFVSDSNKILAMATAISAFLFFKNLKIDYNPIINKIAASVFGVLMIHANSDTMRNWLWRDVLNNVDAFYSNCFFIHAIISVIGVYTVCTLIDMLRIQFLEKPFFRWYDSKHSAHAKPISTEEYGKP